MTQDNYLEAKILTAPSHRLHLMLVEGAIRVGQQAEPFLARGDLAGASPSLTRMIDIVGEMLVGVRQTKSELNEKIADFYWFVIRKITESITTSTAEPLREALKLLDYERQTWQLVCDKLGAAAPSSAPPRAPVFATLSTSPAPAGISLEA